MTGGVLFQSVAEMATIWDLQFRFIYFSHTQWENGEIENVCKRTWETRIFLWKNSELIFSSSGGSCHLCLQTGHCKKNIMFMRGPRKSIFVKRNLNIWTFTNLYSWNKICTFEYLQIHSCETEFERIWKDSTCWNFWGQDGWKEGETGSGISSIWTFFDDL